MHISIEELKQQWRNDPCWDIETTEGFEAHYDELLAYRLEFERQWTENRRRHWAERAQMLGIPGNITLAQYIDRLESRIAKLEEALDN